VKILSAALIAVGLLAAGPVQAQKFDLSKLTCKELTASSRENINLIVMWLAGFNTDEDDPPVVDLDKVKADVTKLGDYCAKHPTEAVMAAAEEALD